MIEWSNDSILAYWTDMSQSDFCDWSLAQRSETIHVRMLRGWQMQSYGEMFDEVSAALQFPYYFGRNFAAYDECMADLGWLRTGNWIICVDKIKDVLRRDKVDHWGTWLDMMIESIQEHKDENSEYNIRCVVNLGAGVKMAQEECKNAMKIRYLRRE